MSATIEIKDDLFCEMIFSLLDQVDTNQQVDWLKKYGANFIDLKLYKFVEERHAISQTEFDQMTSNFWDDEVMYKDVAWIDLQGIIGTNLYQNYLGFGFDDKQTVTDINYEMEGFGLDKAKSYYSPVLLKSIVANHNLGDTDTFSFTKAITTSNAICIVFKIKSGSQDYFYNIITDPC